MTSEDIGNRKWTEAEKAVVRRVAAKQAAGLDLPEKEYDDIPPPHSGSTRAHGPAPRSAAQAGGSASASIPKCSRERVPGPPN